MGYYYSLIIRDPTQIAELKKVTQFIFRKIIFAKLNSKDHSKNSKGSKEKLKALHLLTSSLTGTLKLLTLKK